MLGKRSASSTFRRTTSMAGINFDLGCMEAPPPPPLPPMAMIGGEFNGCDHNYLLSPRYFNTASPVVAGHVGTADFLRSCGLCNRRLAPGRDIYMYRGDTAFCSLECREQQIKQDERKERRAAASAAAVAENGEIHRPELAAAAAEAKTVVAA